MSGLQDIKILNVEDYQASRDATSQLLRRSGFEVIEASTGAEALRLANEEQPGLVQLDVQLPDISGFDVCRRLKSSSVTASIPILQISASFVSREQRVKGLESGSDAYLVKPVEAAELIATIRALLRMHRAEQSQRETEARYQLLFEGNPLPCLIVDRASLSFLAINKAAVRLYGYSRDEFAGLTIKDLRDVSEAPAWHDYIAHIPLVANASQWRHQKKDGTLIDVEIIWHELIYQNRNTLFILVNDITELKRAEQEREELLVKAQTARAEADAANRAKDEFLAVVSHELRPPLNAMLGWSRILQSHQVDEATQVRALATIERSAKMQAQIIEDLLDTARIISGKLRIELHPVNLVPVIKSALEVVRPAAEAKEIAIQVKLDAVSEIISGDADRLQQAVWNLLSNAIKFTPQGGQVTVALRRADPYLQIVVRDSGKGIEKGFLPYVFDRFYQADSTSTRRHSGLGLGLSLVRHLVELHGGLILAESGGENRGSTFTVSLPLRAVRPQSGGLDTTVLPTGGGQGGAPTLLEGLWVLAVGDEVDARELVKTLLQQAGARVTVAGSAREAFAFLSGCAEGECPDVLISDIGMQEEDGYSLIHHVRNPAPKKGGRIPAIALTAYGRAVDRIKVLEAGFQSHIPKPVEAAELLIVIANFTGRNVKGADVGLYNLP